MGTDNDRLNHLIAIRRFNDAEEFAKECIVKNPEWANAYTHLARAYIGQNRYDMAAGAAREGIRKDPFDQWSHGVLAYILNLSGKYTEALVAVKEVLRLAPYYPWGHSLMARIQSNLGNYRASLTSILRGRELDPNDEEMCSQEAWAYYRLDDYQKAIQVANDGLSQYPNSAMIHNLLGSLHWTWAEKSSLRQRQRRYIIADEHLLQAIRYDPSEVAFRNNRRNANLSHRVFLMERGSVLIGILIFFAVVGLGELLGIRRGPEFAAAAGLGLGALVLLTVAQNEANMLLILPLERLRVATIPLERKARRDGYFKWLICGLLYTIGIALVVFKWSRSG